MGSRNKRITVRMPGWSLEKRQAGCCRESSTQRRVRRPIFTYKLVVSFGDQCITAAAAAMSVGSVASGRHRTSLAGPADTAAGDMEP